MNKVKIALIHSNKAFLPAISAYSAYFSRHSLAHEIVSDRQSTQSDFDIEWRFMGTDLGKPKKGIVKIHEYCSSSIPPFPALKNLGKKLFNNKPDFRMFLNDYVKECFGFSDDTPFGFRNVGIPQSWLQQPFDSPEEKQYDFIYTGSIDAFREPQLLLNCFSTGMMKERSLLVISAGYAGLKEKYKDYPNISFIGPIAHDLVAGYLHKARFGINYMPDKEPLNRQTSTKLLEYAACGMAVVSTRYRWMEEFHKKSGGNYFYLSPDLSNFSWSAITNFEYANPDLTEWTWDRQIGQSGVLAFLQSKFPGSF